MKPLHGPNSGGNGLSAAENGAARTSTAAHIGFAVDVVGSGPRVVLVHWSVMNARATWRQQLPLADSFTLVLPNRSGYPPNPPLEYIDFYEQAAEIAGLLDDGSHLVGFSYGGVVALLAAAERAESLRSLTLVEPPALGLARGRAEADSLVLDLAKLVWTGPEEPCVPLGVHEPVRCEDATPGDALAQAGTGRPGADGRASAVGRSVPPGRTGACAVSEAGRLGRPQPCARCGL